MNAPSTHLVIADDHPLFRDALRQAVAGVLTSARIDEAGSFEDLTGLLEQTSDVDLILLDLSMPGISGFSVGPRVAGLGTNVTIQGKVTRRGTSATGPLAGATVGLWWSRDGISWRWTATISATSAARNGSFIGSAFGRRLPIHWNARAYRWKHR